MAPALESDHLPILRRADLLRAQLAHLPLGRRPSRDGTAAIRCGATGSGENLLVLTWSASELAGEVAAGARLFGRLGVGAGARVANDLPGALASPGALLLGDVMEHLGVLDVPLGVPQDAASAAQAWQLVDLVEPAVLVLDPSSAPTLFAAAPARVRPWWTGIVWLRRTTDTAAHPRPPAGFAGWERDWLAVPEAAAFVAHSCAARRFHVDQGVWAEVSDGELVLSPEGVALRYATGLRARLVAGPCACGDGGALLELG